MSSIRTQHDKNNPYVMLNKGALEDSNLSWAAKGLWAYLLGRPDNWHVSVAHLSKLYDGRGGGEKAIYTLLNELIDNGYCERKQEKGKDGQWQSTEYVVHELKECLPHPLQRDAVEPDAVKGGTTNKGVLISNEKTTTAAPPPEPVVVSFHPSLLPLKIQDSEKKWLTEHYDEETVKQAVLFATHPSTKVKTSFIQTLKWACANRPTLPLTREEASTNNKMIAEIIKKFATVPRGVYFEILNKNVEIGFSIGQNTPEIIEYKEYSKDEFLRLLEKAAEKYKIKIKK